MAEKRKKPPTDEIAGVTKDIFTIPIGNVWPNPDKTLRTEGGGKGLEIFEDLLRDPQVRSNLQTRRLAVVGREWEVLPVTDKRADVKLAEFVKQVLLNFSYDAARKALLSGIITGFKPGEVMWEYSEGDVWVKDIIGRSARRFVYDTERSLRLLTWSNIVEGEQLPDRKFVVFTNPADDGSPYGDPLGATLYWPVWFKKNSIKFWLIFADKFGSPTAVGKYPPGTLKPQQDELLGALEAIQQESAIKIPDTMVIELLEAARQGSINTYRELCDFMNADISKTLLGQTLTTEVGDKGSYAASKTHDEVRQDYIKADADALCECQNSTLIRWIVDYNFGPQKKYPKVWIRAEDEEDLKPLAERDEILTRIGLPITKKYFYDTYGIPQPEEGDDLVKSPASEPQKERLTRGGEFTESAERLSAAQQSIESLKEAAAGEWQPAMVPVMEAVQGALDESSSLEEARGRIMNAFGDLDDSLVTDLIARALFNAEALGTTEDADAD